jgi:cytidine deaminase
MAKESLIFAYYRFNQISELDNDDQIMVDQAFEALKGSYSPYSNFKVGAAVLLENGQIVLGANQENAAYPSGLCAERVAMFAAKSQFPDVAVISLAIAVDSEIVQIKSPAAPCGACRQSLLEYELNQDSLIPVILATKEKGVLIVESVQSMLPLFFDKTNLEA